MNRQEKCHKYGILSSLKPVWEALKLHSKEYACNTTDTCRRLGFYSWSGRSLGEINGNPEDEMVRQQHLLNGRKFEQTLGDGEQRGLACFSPWGGKEQGRTW